MTETQIQAKLIKSLEAEGYFVIRVKVASPSGTPDLIAFKDGEYRFIEVKTETGKLSPVQKIIHERMKKKGANVEIYRQ